LGAQGTGILAIQGDTGAWNGGGLEIEWECQKRIWNEFPMTRSFAAPEESGWEAAKLQENYGLWKVAYGQSISQAHAIQA